MKKIAILIGIAAFFNLAILRAQNYSVFQKKEFKSAQGTLPYRILYPESFDSTQTIRYPILFFLHGRGESGNDNEKQLTHGAQMFLDSKFRNHYPAIIVFPQCAEDSYWSNVRIKTNALGKRNFSFRKRGKPSSAMYLLLQLVYEYKTKKYTKNTKFYVGGLSMGGMGTYELLRRSPHTFAAAFAICGGDLKCNAKRYRIPLWVFHGEKDDIVSPKFSHQIVRVLQKRNAQVRYCFYPKDNHNSWDSAFAEPELLPWLFSHNRINFKEK